MNDAITLSVVVNALENGGRDPCHQSDGSYRAKCPAHDGGDHNLSVTEKSGKVLLMCHSRGCTYLDVLSALNLHNGMAQVASLPVKAKRGRGRPPRVPEATYRYEYGDGSHAFDVLRFDDPKTFRPRLPDGTPKAHPQPRPIYHLPDIGEGEIVILEGERDADAWKGAYSTPSTTWAHGAKAWHMTDWQPLRGRDVLIVADADAPGHKAAQGLGSHLAGLDCKVSLALAPVGYDAGNDFSDWFAKLGAEGARELVEGLRQPLAPESVTHFPHRDASALETAFEDLGVEIRYNLRRQQSELREGGETWHEFTDRSTGKLRRRIGERFTYHTDRGPRRLHYGRDTWKDCTDAIMYDHEIDPFLEWLNSLEKWDGTDRLDHWRDVFVLDDTNNPELVAWASRFVFLGATWRAFKPGTKLDEMPVLVGQQGIGKSTALRLALPPDQPELFADGLHLAAGAKDRAEALQGRVIVEVAEMAGTNRAELESLKAFLSRVDDGTVRLAYRHNPESSPRRAVIVGTTNDETPLPNDPSGNRRFVVVRIVDGDVGELVDYLNGSRNQLWAEAVHRYRSAEQAWLPGDLKRAQTEANEGARRRDHLIEDAAEAWIEGRDVFTMAEAVSGVGLVRAGEPLSTVSQRDIKRVAACFTRLGFASGREWNKNTKRHTTKWRRLIAPEPIID